MGMWTRIFGKKEAIDTDNDKLAVEKLVEEQREEQEVLDEVKEVGFEKDPMPLNLKKKDTLTDPYPNDKPVDVLKYKPMPSTAEIKKEYRKQTKKAVAKKAKPDPILGSVGSHLAKKQREELREHLIHLKPEHNKMETINIIQPPRGRGTSNGDVYIGKKHGYFRITMEVAEKLAVEAGSYLIIANFGADTLLIARKPQGQFGYELKAQQGTVKNKSEPTSLFCNNTSVLSNTGLALGNWYIDKHEPQVEDLNNNVTWLKFKHESL